MAVKVTVKFDILEAIKEINSRVVKEEVARETINLIKDFTSKGISPIKEGRRFDRYKDPEKYPGDRKPRVPVNLRLSGDMMSALTFWFTPISVFIGFKDPKQNVKAAAHNEGTDTIPQRPFIPTVEGTEFNLTIMKRIRDIYSQALDAIIKKGNR